MCCGDLLELVLGAYLHPRTQRMFEVGIEPFIRVEFGTVAGQVEHLDLLFVLSQPGLDGLAVMDAQVVQNQKHLLGRILDQRLHKLDELVAVEGPINDHPACFALVGDR